MTRAPNPAAPAGPPAGQPADILKIRRLLPPLLAYGFVSNLAALVTPLFMMQVLDRVVPSGNMATLLLLLVIAVAALLASSLVDFARDRVLGRLARWVDRLCTLPLLAQPPQAQAEAAQALAAARGMLSGGGLVALLNLAWVPVFLAGLGLIHWAYPLLALVMVAALWLARKLGDLLAADPRQSAVQLGEQERAVSAQIAALGRQPLGPAVAAQLAARLDRIKAARLAMEEAADGPSETARAGAGFLRQMAQLAALAAGAALVARGQISAGGMIAASILTAKAVTAAEQGLATLAGSGNLLAPFATLAALPTVAQGGLEAVPFEGRLRAEGLIYPRGGGAPPRLERVSFTLEPGQCLAVIGDSGSGKTTLLKALAGLDPAPVGGVLLDDTDVRQLSPLAHGAAVGYLPQLAELLPGTIAENIAGFRPEATDAEVVAAAKRARAHGMISALPEGYATDLTRAGNLLTAGQRQQVALAAALFPSPRYLFLDEPNALLDRHAEAGLCETLSELKAAGATIVMVLHRAGIIGLADMVAVLDRGRLADFGPRSQVLGRQAEGRRTIRLPLRETSLQDLADWITRQFTRAGDAPFAAKAVLLGTEMFQAALLNGPQDVPREARLDFSFQDDTHCTLELREDGPSEAGKRMVEVRAAMAQGAPDDAAFKPQERPLATAERLASRLSVESSDTRTCIRAELAAQGAPADLGRPH
ncbi:Type I secretion system ATP-binding protein PrsD [Pseudoruegeria aquimaris]|uniref:Type I secretion system ATP-binding protein PrsD n=1 Tax=Pseudoruegeria aquimaris TaxID=393663 RepID=A0A1Y5RNR2_9RHOB|nr:ATP-binding cassette domain-containing protein [Pseudoruegeria aquimaris]SLN21922.1 Type I secretion system ATP-binding protein PrsD [Pseudoruegeria aquimaris]